MMSKEESKYKPQGVQSMLSRLQDVMVDYGTGLRDRMLKERDNDAIALDTVVQVMAKLHWMHHAELTALEAKLDKHLEAVRPIVEQPRNEQPTEPTVVCEWSSSGDNATSIRLLSNGNVEHNFAGSWEDIGESIAQDAVDALRAAGLLRLPGDADPAAGLVEALESVRMDTHHESQAWKVATDALAIYREMTEGK